MSNCDNYEFAKSLEQQSSNSETPYSNLQYQYINDLNNGIYSNGGLTLLQFDLSSIYNSNSMIDMNKAYLAIPIQIATALTTQTTPGTLLTLNGGTASASNAWSYVGLKNSYTTLVHAAELQVGGQTVEMYQPYNSNYTYFKLCSEMSIDDLRSIGSTIGMGREIDNPESLRYNSASATAGGAGTGIGTTGAVGPFMGNGLVNNQPFGLPNPNFGDQTVAGTQIAAGPYNNSYYYRLNKVIDVTQSTAGSGTVAGTQYGTTGFATASNINLEGKAYFTYGSNGTVAIVNDVAIIRLGDILDSMRNLPLTKRFSGQLRIYLNTGMIAANSMALASPYCMATSAGYSTFTNTCPLMISALPAAAYTASSQGNQITTSLSVGKFNGGTIAGVSIPAQSGGILPSCRLYFPQVTLKPEKLRFYLDQGLNRKVNYTSYYFNQFAGISASGTFSGTVQSQVRRPRGILILPFLSPNTGTGITGAGNGTNATLTGIVPFSDQLSPFSCAPCQTGALSLTNIQVSVGGQNFLQNALQYSWSAFQEQTMLHEKLNGIDLGMKCGLFSEYNFENAYRCYYVDLSRGTLADELTDRTISMSLTNNNNATIDLYTFVEYFNEIEINVENGIVKR